MNVDAIYSLILFILNKSQHGYLGPDDFARVINMAQRSYISFLLGNLPSYTPGHPVSKVELGLNAVVRQRLAPAIYGYNLTVDATGFSPYPLDYLQTDAMWSIYGFNRIRNIPQEKLYSVYNSTIDPIASNPIYLIEDKNFRFYPTNTAAARLSYVKNPPDMKWNYTLDVNGDPVYNAIGSVQPIWADDAILEIIVRALRMIGVSLQFAEVSQYSEEIKNKGQ